MKCVRSLSVGALALAALALPSVAKAEKPGVLEGKPIVERRLELRKLRIQVSPHAGISVAQPYVHVVTVGAKLQFDFTDWLGVRAGFDYSVGQFATELTSKIVGNGEHDPVLPVGVDDPNELVHTQTKPGVDRFYWHNNNPAPLLHDFQAGLTYLDWQTSFDIVFTPFAGKLGLFSGIFTEYDAYVFGGVGLMNWKNMYEGAESTATAKGLKQALSGTDPGEGFCLEEDGERNSDCVLHPVEADTGIRFGASIGGGIHIFVSDWFSVNPEIQDIIVRHNDTGLNKTREIYPVVQNDNKAGSDRKLRHNLTFRLGLTFYFPPRAKRATMKP